MTKGRTTARQRARRLQALYPLLTFGAALAEVRSGNFASAPSTDCARRALTDLAADASVHTSWRERICSHLDGSACAGWPAPADCLELCADLYAAAGLSRPAEGMLGVPLPMVDMPLTTIVVALESLAQVAGGVPSKARWLGVRPSAGQDLLWDATAPWHRAAQQYAVAVAVAVTLAGSLRALLQLPYGDVAPVVDVVYKAPPVWEGPRSLRTVWTYAPSGLRMQQVAYPRPRGTREARGAFDTSTATGRLSIARAVLVHALGGAAPAAWACCTGCAGTGWLEPLDDGHLDHRPHRGEAEDPGAATYLCLCGLCRGTGNQILPVREFAQHFLTPLTPSWAVNRWAVLDWAAEFLDAPGGMRAPVPCAPGLQSGYLEAVVARLRQEGIRVDDAEGCGVDFDTRGGLGAWITLPEHPFPAPRGHDRVGTFLAWYSDLGWWTTEYRAAGLGIPARMVMGDQRRALCPQELVPTPEQVVRALLTCSDAAQRPRAGQPQGDVMADSYAQVVAYLG